MKKIFTALKAIFIVCIIAGVAYLPEIGIIIWSSLGLVLTSILEDIYKHYCQ